MAVQMFSDVSLLAAVLFKQQVVTVPFLTVLFQQQLRCLEMFHYWQLCCLNNSLSQLALLFSTAVQMLRHVSLQAAVLFKQQFVATGSVVFNSSSDVETCFITGSCVV